MTKFKDLTGQRFTRLLVLKQEGKDKRGKIRWSCICDCGVKVNRQGYSLTRGHCKSCGCLTRERNAANAGENSDRWSGYKEITGTFFNQIKQAAKVRKLKLEVNIVQLWELFIKQNRKCALTGVELTLNKFHNDRSGTASVDRIDSTKHYTIDNVQWVHKNVNYMKQDFTQEEFVALCRLVVNYADAK